MEKPSYKACVYGDMNSVNHVLIRNSAIKTKLSFSVYNSEPLLVSFFEMPTVSAEGSRVDVISSNRNLKDFPPVTINDHSHVEDFGFPLLSFLSLNESESDDWILEPDTNYLIVTKQTAGEGSYSFFFDISEVSEDDGSS